MNRKIFLQITIAIVTLMAGVLLSKIFHHKTNNSPQQPIPFANPTTNTTPHPLSAEQFVNPPDTLSNPLSQEAFRPADFMTEQDDVSWGDYRIQRRLRRHREVEPGPSPHSEWFDVEYVVLTHGKRSIRFDADMYSGYGNSARFGFFPFLGSNSQELFISQDIFRGGNQWVVDLEPKPRIIFDGREFGVGREANDLTALDLDSDGTFEIVVPLYFYDFQDRMSPSQVPSPEIIFKFDAGEKRYLPANQHYKEHLLRYRASIPQEATSDERNFRSAAMRNFFDLVYAGNEQEAWANFQEHYELSDKTEIEQRLREILRTEPVYNFIYNHRRPKR